MKIGELAQATGFKDKTIRYYEQQGLLPDPVRTASGYREYGPEDLDRLGFIRKAKSLGLSLQEIKDILQAYDRKEPRSAQVQMLLREKLVQTEQAIRDLQELRGVLEDLRAKCDPELDCQPSGDQTCGILESAWSGSHN